MSFHENLFSDSHFFTYGFKRNAVCIFEILWKVGTEFHENRFSENCTLLNVAFEVSTLFSASPRGV